MEWYIHIFLVYTMFSGEGDCDNLTESPSHTVTVGMDLGSMDLDLMVFQLAMDRRRNLLLSDAAFTGKGGRGAGGGGRED